MALRVHNCTHVPAWLKPLHSIFVFAKRTHKHPTSLEAPLHHGLAQSVQLMWNTADTLQQENPQRELHHTETLLR